MAKRRPTTCTVGETARRRFSLRLVRVTAPQGKGEEVARVALAVGIAEATVHQAYAYGPNRAVDSLDVAVSTRQAKDFIDTLMDAPFFDPHEYAIAVRQPRTIIKGDSIENITWPVVEPITDIYEELWQYTHVTGSFIVRVLVAALLIAHGLVDDNALTLGAGLLFIPLLRAVLAISFGAWAGELRLAVQGAYALALGLGLTVVGGVIVGLVSQSPVKFDHFSSPLAGLLISAIVGIAAAVSNADDSGERQLIGLGVAAQVAIVPAWFGVALVFGSPQITGERLMGLAMNLVALLVTAAVVFAVLRLRAPGLRRYVAEMK